MSRELLGRYIGSNPDRQSIGKPGHCAACRNHGHVAAHPQLGCADVGCHESHEETPQNENSESQKKEAAMAPVEKTASVVADLKPTFVAPYDKPSDPTGEEVVIVSVDGLDYYERECFKKGAHDAHPWKSYRYGTPTRDNAICYGTGEPPVWKKASGNYPHTPLHDYSTDPDFPVSDPITVAEAKKIAYHMHRFQTDKLDKPYKMHLSAVEQGVRLFGGTDEERIAALFHDSVEDGHTTYALLKKINLTEHTIGTIEAVSKRPSEEQSKYLSRIIEFGESALRVKLADLFHNTRKDRLKALPTHTKDRLLRKYRPSIARIMLELQMIEEDKDGKIATVPKGSSGSYGYTTGSGYGSSTTPTWSSKKERKKTTVGGNSAQEFFKPAEKDSPEVAEQGKSWSVATIFAGDWVVGWPAPVIDAKPMAGDTHRFALANGEIREEQSRGEDHRTRSLFAVAFANWSRDDSFKFQGVSESDINTYMEVLAHVKDRKIKVLDQ